MTENKQKLIALVSALEEENIVDYLYTFIGLKVYGHAKLPDSITAELRQIWEEHHNLSHEGEKQPEPEEMIANEKAAMFHRCEILKAIYDITSVTILNYINIIVRGVHKDAQEHGQLMDIQNEQCIENIRRNLISEYAKSNKNSLAGFACQCEISKAMLDKLLYRGCKEIYLSTVLRISNALEKPVTWLIGVKED